MTKTASAPAVPDDDVPQIDLSELTEEERAAYRPDDEEDDPRDEDGEGQGEEDGEEGSDNAAGEPDDEPEEAAEEDEPEPAAAKTEDKAPEARPDAKASAIPEPIAPTTFFSDDDAKALAEAEAAKEKLFEDYDEGGMEIADFRKAVREADAKIAELSGKKTRAETEIDTFRRAFEAKWHSDVATWFEGHPEMPSPNATNGDPVKEAIVEKFDAIVRQVNSTSDGKVPNSEILDTALDIFHRRHKGLVPQVTAKQDTKEDDPKPAKRRQRPALPPNIGSLPAAGTQSDDEGHFAQLDRLATGGDLEKYEAACERMMEKNPDLYERYLAQR